MRTSAQGWVKTMSELAQAKGLDVPALFARAGLDYQGLSQPYYRFPQDQISKLWQLMVEATGNAHLGLEFGRHTHVSTFGVLGYLFLSAATVKQALELSIKYQHYLAEALSCQLEQVGESYYFDIHNLGDKQRVSPQALDAILSAFIALATWIFRQPIQLQALYIGHGQTKDVSAYQQLVSCPVYFEAGHTRLALAASWVHSTLPSADPLMFSQQQKWLEESIAQNQHRLTAEVKQRIKSLLAGGAANKEAIAQSLFMTAKTLQRRLADEGSQFQQLLEECRQELACELLQQSHVELLEVAELVGYHDYSTFAKAFKQWTRLTPKAWREQ